MLLLRPNLDHAAIQLQLKSAQGLPRILGDAAQIEQVLLALMVNAIDAMPKGGNLWIESALGQGGKTIVLTVRDDGAGIAPEVMPKIFEPFVTTKEHGRGTGLGLAVSRGIVERHSGKISLQSELGKGTTVTITLPVPDTRAAGTEHVLAGADTKMR